MGDIHDYVLRFNQRWRVKTWSMCAETQLWLITLAVHNEETVLVIMTDPCPPRYKSATQERQVPFDDSLSYELFEDRMHADIKADTERYKETLTVTRNKKASNFKSARR